MTRASARPGFLARLGIRLALGAALAGAIGPAMGQITISQVSENGEHTQLLAYVSPGIVAREHGPVFEAALADRPLKVVGAAPVDPSGGLSMILAVDISQSMRHVGFDRVRGELGSVLAQLPATSRAALLTIGALVRIPVDFGPVQKVADEIARLMPDEPDTALNDALIQAQSLAARDAAQAPLRHVVLLVTDGVDDDKKAIGSREMLAAVGKGGIPIYAVALTRAAEWRQQQAGLAPFAEVVRASGGMFLQSRPEDLRATLQNLLGKALDADVVTIDCTGCRRDGELRKLLVREKLAAGESVAERDLALFPQAGRVEVAADSAPASSPATTESARSRWGWDFNVDVNVAEVLKYLAVIMTLLLGGGGLYAHKHPEQVRELWAFVIRRGPDGSTGVDRPDDKKTVASAADKASSFDLTVDVSEVGRMQVTVGAQEIVLGRDKAVDIVVPAKDAKASARHAALYAQKGVVMLRDLGSLNGTFLNGTRIVSPEPVHDRDVVGIGTTDVRVYFGRL